jgi:uncharacterized protein involved in response to NO
LPRQGEILRFAQDDKSSPSDKWSHHASACYTSTVAIHVPLEPARSAPPAKPAGFALFALGFRPFYLAAGIFAALSVPLWVARFAGWLGEWVYYSESVWHAHEMIFGYALAVIVGFLFTAVRNWTGRPTPTGARLAGTLALWLAARVLVLTPWTELAAVCDTAFALAAAAGIAVPLFGGGNRRNYFFVAILVLMGAINLVFYLGKSDVLDIGVGEWVQLALDLILFVMTVIAGRVIPMFTANAVPGANPARIAWIERAAIASILALAIGDAFDAPAAGIAAVAALACTLHAVRLALWRPWKTTGKPILWILHASYAWIVVHLLLRVFAASDMILPSLAIHALTAGAIGGMTLGMMTRTARGHTGRPLVASPLEVASYVLVQLAALARVFGPMLAPSHTIEAMIVSGALWFAAFALFVVVFFPILTRARADGKPG